MKCFGYHDSEPILLRSQRDDLLPSTILMPCCGDSTTLAQKFEAGCLWVVSAIHAVQSTMNFAPSCRLCLRCRASTFRPRDPLRKRFNRAVRAYSSPAVPSPSTSPIILADQEDALDELARPRSFEAAEFSRSVEEGTGISSGTFVDYAGELERRKRKIEAKRRQGVRLASFIATCA